VVTIKEKWMPSPNYSTSRSGYNKIVLHTTEGAMDITSLGNWFANPSAGCSSHHGADNSGDVFGAYVYENHKAWTQGNANPYCLSLEMCAYASWSRSTWINSKGRLLDNAALWIRYCVDKYGVPWTVLNNTQAQDPNVRGICEHVNFGSWGSGHHDCGSGFPMDVVIDKAKKLGSSGSAPSTEEYMSTVAIDYDPSGAAHMACIGDNHRVYYKPPDSTSWRSCDDGSYSIHGVGISVKEGRITIVYTNKGHNACSYQSTDNGASWTWHNHGGNLL
jgi:hypothetical protein